jgi:hypothetical protein
VDSKADCSGSCKKMASYKNFLIEEEINWRRKDNITLAGGITQIRWHLIKNDDIYGDEIGFGKRKIQKRMIVET